MGVTTLKGRQPPPVVSTKPYLVRAIHEWCSDHGFTPYLVVAVDENTRVPREHVKDGQIVLNISYDATQRLVMDNEAISFYARFAGRAMPIYIPMDCVAAIYARENGQGMAFEVNLPLTESTDDKSEDNEGDGLPQTDTQAVSEPAAEPLSPKPGRPKLTRIK